MAFRETYPERDSLADRIGCAKRDIQFDKEFHPERVPADMEVLKKLCAEKDEEYRLVNEQRKAKR